MVPANMGIIAVLANNLEFAAIKVPRCGLELGTRKKETV